MNHHFPADFFLGIPKYEGPSDSLQTWSLRETNCSILPRSKSQFQNISMATGENIYKTTWLPTKKVAQDIWFLYIYIYSYIHDTLPEINVDDSCADVFYIWYMIYIYISHIPTSFSLGWCWTNPSCWMTFQVQLILGGKKGGWGPGVYEVEV